MCTNTKRTTYEIQDSGNVKMIIIIFVSEEFQKYVCVITMNDNDNENLLFCHQTYIKA